MSEEEIQQLLSEHEEYALPDMIVEQKFALTLVKSNDPMSLLRVPEPFRSQLIRPFAKVAISPC